jgi:hypothetical protein
MTWRAVDGCQAASAWEAPPSAWTCEPLVQDGAEHTDPVTECAQVTDAVNPAAFEAGNLSDGKARRRDTHVDERLNLKAIAPEAPGSARRQDSRGVESQGRKVCSPEDVEAVAQIRVFCAVEHIDRTGQHSIAEGTQASDVFTASASSESRSLSEVSPVEKSRNEARDLTGVGGAVGVNHNDDIASGRRTSASKRVTFARARLHHDADIWSQLTCDRQGVVHGVTIDNYYFIGVTGQCAQYIGQVTRLIQSRNYDGHARP